MLDFIMLGGGWWIGSLAGGRKECTVLYFVLTMRRMCGEITHAQQLCYIM